MAGALAGHMMDMRKQGKLGKPTVRFHASVDTMGPGSEDSKKYEKEEMKRLHGEIKALGKAIKDFDPEQASRQAKRSLETELEVKKARLAECKARMGEETEEVKEDDGDSY